MNQTPAQNLEPQATPDENGVVPARQASTRAEAVRASAMNSLEKQRIAEKAGGLVMQARRAARAQNRKAAMELLQQALTLCPTDAPALELLGDLFLEDAEQEKALKAFEYGLKNHPGHRGFEEKIALCILDLEEMKRASELAKNPMEPATLDKWLQVSPQRAFGLSAVLPGAGHVYAEENERAAWIFGAYVFTLLGWSLPLYFALKSAANGGTKGLNAGLSAALGGMNAFVLFWFWLMIAAGVGIYVYGLFDAMAAAERANERRKFGFESF